VLVSALVQVVLTVLSSTSILVDVSRRTLYGSLHTDLGFSPVREEITNISHKYKDKLTLHPNELATTLLSDEVEPRRLKRFKPADLMKQHI
jgi:hypothetical protein